MRSLLPKDLHSELILSSLQLVLCHVAAVKRLPVHYHSADYIFSGPLGSLDSDRAQNEIMKYFFFHFELFILFCVGLVDAK